MELYEIVGCAFIGFFATMIGGFWGLGGGVFIVPALLVSGVDISIAAPASLLQMLPSTFLTVRKQFTHIGWGKNSWGRTVAIPLCTATFLGGFLGKNLGVWLREVTNSSSSRQVLYLVLIAYLLYKTLADKQSDKDKQGEQLSAQLRALFTMLAGVSIGTVSTLLGIGGGSITRPVLASVLKMPEKPVGQIARLNVFVTALAGTISYLLLGSSSLEKSGNTEQIIIIGLALAAGGVFGFPLGAKMHSIVLEAKQDIKARKGYAILLTLLFICVGTKLFGLILLSQIIIIISGIFVCAYLTYLTKDSKRITGLRDENQSN